MSDDVMTVFGVPGPKVYRMIRACGGMDLPAGVAPGAVQRLVTAAENWCCQKCGVSMGEPIVDDDKELCDCCKDMRAALAELGVK